MNSNCSNLLYLRNLQEQVKKAFCYQKVFWPFTVRTNCSKHVLKHFANSRLSASIFKSFSQSLEQCFLTVGQNNFGNKIPFLSSKKRHNPFHFFILFWPTGVDGWSWAKASHFIATKRRWFHLTLSMPRITKFLSSCKCFCLSSDPNYSIFTVQ